MNCERLGQIVYAFKEKVRKKKNILQGKWQLIKKKKKKSISGLDQ